MIRRAAAVTSAFLWEAPGDLTNDRAGVKSDLFRGFAGSGIDLRRNVQRCRAPRLKRFFRQVAVRVGVTFAHLNSLPSGSSREAPGKVMQAQRTPMKQVILAVALFATPIFAFGQEKVPLTEQQVQQQASQVAVMDQFQLLISKNATITVLQAQLADLQKQLAAAQAKPQEPK